MQEKKDAYERLENWLQGNLSIEESEAMGIATQKDPKLSKMANDCALAMTAIRFHSEEQMREKIKRWDEKYPPGQDAPPPVPFAFTSWFLVLLFCMLGAGSTGSWHKLEKPAAPPTPVPADLPQPMAQPAVFQPILPDLETNQGRHSKNEHKTRQPAVQQYCIFIGKGDIKGMREAEKWVRASGYFVDKKKRDYKDGTFRIVAFPSDLEAGTWMLDLAAQPQSFAIVDIRVGTNRYYM